MILPRAKLGPHRQHEFQLENVETPYSHIRVTIYPDGGIKRVRVFGRRVGGGAAQGTHGVGAAQDVVSDTKATVADDTVVEAGLTETATSANVTAIPALALTPEAFAPFGKVVQAYEDVNAVPTPRSLKITGANQGSAVKFHKLALLAASYPPEAGATAGLSVYRCKPTQLGPRGEWRVRLLERHPATNQAFVPMGSATGENALVSPGQRYLVIVARSGEDGKPDLKTLRAFIASAGQAIVYDTAVWRKCFH